jgi:hypothetical protein
MAFSTDGMQADQFPIKFGLWLLMGDVVHWTFTTSLAGPVSESRSGKSARLGTPNDRSYRKCAGEDASCGNECSSRRTFDKAVSSKPLAFAADAGPMGIECRFGTRVRVGRCICGVEGLTLWRADHGGEAGYYGDFGSVAGNTRLRLGIPLPLRCIWKRQARSWGMFTGRLVGRGGAEVPLALSSPKGKVGSGDARARASRERPGSRRTCPRQQSP